MDFREQLSKRFTIKSKIVGSGASPAVHSGAASGGCGGALQGAAAKEEFTESRILNRIVRWTSTGWEYEADQRHA